MSNVMSNGFLRDATTRALAVSFAGADPPVFGASLGTPVKDASNELTTLSFTGVNAPAGALVIVAASWYDAGATATLTGGSVTWTLIKQQNGTGDTSRHIGLFAALVPAGLSNATLTGTFSPAAYGRALWGAYFTGATATAITTSGGHATPSPGSGSAPWTAPDLTVTGAALGVAAAWLDGGYGSNTSSGGTEAVDFNDGVVGTWVLAYRTRVDAGTLSLAGTIAYTDAGGGQEEWISAAAAFGP